MHPAIQLTDITRRYGTVQALDQLSLTVPSGQVLALLGPNGAGKSTATEVVLGLTKPDSGTVTVFGRSPHQAIREGSTGAMLQNGALLDTSVRRLIHGVRGLHRHPLPINDVIELSGISGFLNTSTAKLSGGQAQRVRFALAIMGDPALLILDEPTVGLDVETRRHFWATMREFAANDRTVVFATHYLDEADEYADRIVVLHAGKVIADGSGAAVRGIVGGRQISFLGPEHDYLSLPGVVDAAMLGPRHVLTCADSDETLRALLSMASPISAIEVTSPSLEDAFLTLTKAA